MFAGLRQIQKSEEMQIPIKDYIISSKKDEMELICDLFCHKSRNDKILNQILRNNYKIPDVITAILSLSQEHKTLCLKQASNFNILMNYWTNEFLNALIKQINAGKSVRIILLVGDKRNIIEKVKYLKEKAKLLQQTNITYSQIEQNTISLFYQNKLKIQTDFKLLFEETFNNNYNLLKDHIDVYDLLHCMIKKH